MLFLIRWTCPAHSLAEVMEGWNTTYPPQPYETRYGAFDGAYSERGLESYSIVEVGKGEESKWAQGAAQSLGQHGVIEGYIAEMDVAQGSPNLAG